MPLILPSQRVIRPSPLAYPAGAKAGFDRSHPASRGLLMSAVSVPGGSTIAKFGNLLTGELSSNPSSGTTSIDGTLGPSGYIPIGQSAANMGAGPNVVQTHQTFACIVRPINIGTGGNYYGYVLGNSGAGTHSGIYIVGNQLEYFGNSDVFSGINLSNGVPYFVALSVTPASAAANAAVFVVANLQTGAIQTAQAVASTTPRVDAFFYIGSDSSNEGSESRIAAAMYSNQRMSLSELVAWAKSPWEFWFPNKTINLASSTVSVGASFLPVWAYRYNLPVLGTGNF